MLVNKNLLKPNEFSSFLYDEFSFLNADDRDLFNDISRSGELLTPLVITTDYVVISGVRRLKIVNDLSNITEVPVSMTEYHSSELNHAIVIRYNIQRQKSIVEISKEYEALQIIYNLKQGVDTESSKYITGKKEQKTLIESTNSAKSIEKTISRVISAKKYRMSLYGESHTEAWKKINEDFTKGIEPNTINEKLKKEHESRENEKRAPQTKLLNTNSIKILNKDSSDLSEDIEDESVDCIPTSPPYAMKIVKYIKDKVKKGNSLGEEETIEEFVANRMVVLRECKRIIKESGSIFINIMDQRKDGRILRLESKIADAFEDEGMVLINRMIWFKNNPTYESNNGFQKSMEYILHFVKDPKNYKWNTDWLDDKITFLGDLAYGEVGKQRKIRDVITYDFPSGDDSSYIAGKLKTNVINNTYLKNILKKRGYTLSHSALFPIELPLICVLSTTDPGDLVCDVWGGLSTSGIAAYANNCRYIGVDQSGLYSAMASERLEDFIETFLPIERHNDEV
jgi:site-specific DNA-methyltransferase (adenine-specific)